MGNIEEKNIFLQELENEEAEEKSPKNKSLSKKKKKGVSATAIFAATFVFFIFIVILLIFVLGLSGSGNPFFASFGIEPYEVKTFLKNLVNKTFLIFIILLLLATAIGIFRGYSLPKEEKIKRRGSFVFGAVSGGLIFISILAWGGAMAFVENFVVQEIRKEKIELLGFEDGRDIIAPVDIEFSATQIKKSLLKKGLKPEQFRWSKDGGKTYTPFSLQESIILQFFQKGKQKVTIEVQLKDGEIRSYERNFSVDSATFSHSPNIALAQKKVTFSAKELISNGKKFQWDFDGDGVFDATSRTPTINHTFERSGKYTVKMRAEKRDDSVEVFSKEITIRPEAGKSIISEISMESDPKGKAPLEMVFSAENSFTQEGDIEKFSWKIGEKKLGSQKIVKKGLTISHIFQDPGTYIVSLEVTNTLGEKDSTDIEVVVMKGNSAPNAVISSKPSLSKNNKKQVLEGKTPFTLYFSGEKSTDPDENIQEYNWKILDTKKSDMDAVLEEIQGNTGEYTFRDPGEYSIDLEVIDSEGEKNTTTLQVSLTEPPVIPIVKASPETGTLPLIVEFSGSESSCKTQGCKILSFEWDFNDGTPVNPTGANIAHQFSKTGTFEVVMTAITNTGERAKVVKYITVTQPPFSACFIASRTNGSLPLAVRFDPNSCSKGEIVKYQWDFGDGYISSQRKPKHTYKDAGVYTAKLKIFDKDGRVSSAKNIITVKKSE